MARREHQTHNKQKKQADLEIPIKSEENYCCHCFEIEESVYWFILLYTMVIILGLIRIYQDLYNTES
jgi:hypothetical protein